jgi:tartrate dehydrogenase/decarboxylase/D-malate dehydrogenase
MMLDHLGEHDAYKRILRAIEAVISDDRVRTPDLGGKATTEDMTRAVTNAMTQGAKQTV